MQLHVNHNRSTSEIQTIEAYGYNGTVFENVQDALTALSEIISTGIHAKTWPNGDVALYGDAEEAAADPEGSYAFAYLVAE